MANSDKKQAALDAVQDILKARLASAMGQAGMPGMGGPGGEIDIDIDPELDTPEASGPQGGGNTEINDPDDVLGQKKNRQKPQNQQGQGGGSSKSSSDKEDKDKNDSGENSGGSQDSGKQDTKQDNSQNQKGGSSSKDEKGDNQKDSNGGSDDKKSDDDKKGLTQDDIEKASKNEPGKKSDDYVKDWNDAIDKFDNDKTSDEDLEKEATDSKNSKATKDAVKAIQASRERKLEIDPDYDKRLKMPKNSEIKQMDDSDDESDEDREKRVTNIQKSFDDADAVEADLKNIETDIAIKQADAMRAKRTEQEKIAQKGKLLDFSDFSMDLFDAIKSQLDQSPEPEDSYYRPNATYAGTDYLMPGQIYPERQEIPEVNVYFDLSPSWNYSHVQKGLDAIASLTEFEQQRRIKINVFYFADHLHDEPGRAAGNRGWYEGGTGGFPEVVKHVRDSGAENVIIMSDSDIEGQTYWSNVPATEVPGCVWYLWKQGSRSRSAVTHLFGAEGTFQYNLN